MRKKRIAVLIDWYLPGNKAGGPVRSVYSMVSLLKNDFDFYIITTNHDLGGQPYTDLEPNTWLNRDGVPVYYFSDDQLSRANLQQVIDRCKPDIIYLNSFWSYWFSIVPLWLKKKGLIRAKLILAPRGMLGAGALAIKPLKKRAFLFASKLRGLHKGVLFHANTIYEEQEVRRFFRKNDVIVAPNVNATPVLHGRRVDKQPGSLRLFYLSRIVPIKNLRGALNILAGIKTEGEIVYDIYGALEDQAYWQECEGILKKMPPNIKVSYKGELAFNEVQQAISSYHYLFLPTLNENYGHSIIESLLSGCPVIISDRTPWNGVNDYKCGSAIPPANEEAFRNCITTALQLDNAAYTAIVENCITFATEKAGIHEAVASHKTLFS